MAAVGRKGRAFYLLLWTDWSLEMQPLSADCRLDDSKYAKERDLSSQKLDGR